MPDWASLTQHSTIEFSNHRTRIFQIFVMDKEYNLETNVGGSNFKVRIF